MDTLDQTIFFTEKRIECKEGVVLFYFCTYLFLIMELACSPCAWVSFFLQSTQIHTRQFYISCKCVVDRAVKEHQTQVKVKKKKGFLFNRKTNLVKLTEKLTANNTTNSKKPAYLNKTKGKHK